MLACRVACVAWSWWAGRDLNWDQLNYHYYTASICISTTGSLGISWAQASYGIARVLIPAQTRNREAMIAASVVLALLAPLDLLEVGSSFIDVTTTLPVLAGVLLLMLFHGRPARAAPVFIAAVLLGSACALKLTNVIFALAAPVFVLFATIPERRRTYLLAGYAVGGAAGFLLGEGGWAPRLYREFGNPYFPFFNAWFRSSDFPPFNIQHARFVAQSVGTSRSFRCASSTSTNVFTPRFGRRISGSSCCSSCWGRWPSPPRFARA
jgi:hypothetical protein